MNRFVPGFINFINDEAGVTAIEYALIAALIAVVIIAGATSVGLNVNDVFNKVAGTISNA